MAPRSVLILSYPFPPAASAAVLRTIRFVKYLPESGWKPLVLTPRVDAVYPIRLDHSLDKLVPDGTFVQRTGAWRPIVAARKMLEAIFPTRTKAPGADKGSGSGAGSAHGPGETPKRRPGLFRAMANACERWSAMPDPYVGWVLPAIAAGLRLVRRFRPSAIYSTGPPHSTHLIALALKRITGLPIVLDFRDPWARREWKSGAEDSLRGRMEAKLEWLCVRSSDRVVLNTPRLRDEFCSAYEPRFHGKFLVIPNGYDPDLLARISRLAKDGSERRNGVVRLCHTGSLYGRRDLRPLADAVEGLSASGLDVTLEQVGLVDGRAELSAYLRKRGLEGRVRLTERLPHDETLRRLAAANVLVVIQPGTRTQVPGKLYEMLMFRKPILAVTEEGATADIMREFGLGEVASSGDSGAIARAIVRLSQNRGETNADRGLDAALQAFDGRELTRRLAEALHAISS